MLLIIINDMGFTHFKPMMLRGIIVGIPAVIECGHPHSLDADISVGPGQHTHLTRVSDSGCVPHDHLTLAVSVLSSSTQHTTRMRKTTQKKRNVL